MAMLEGRKTRDERVAFKISETHKEKLHDYAREYGVSVSALCALVVGQWIYQQDKIVGPMLEDLNKTLGDTLAKHITSDIQKGS